MGEEALRSRRRCAAPDDASTGRAARTNESFRSLRSSPPITSPCCITAKSAYPCRVV